MVTIKPLHQKDIAEVAEAFKQLGWNKPASQYERYLEEQKQGVRDIYVARVENKFAGYLTICWTSHYPPFHEANIPEIVDFNVLPKYRRQHIGTALMDKAESEIVKRSPIAGIGVGTDTDFGAAQRMYATRGYIPDARGLYYKDHHLKYGEQITVDYDLAMYFTKVLK